MDQLNRTVKSFDNTMNEWLSVVDRNEYISAAVTLFLIMYAGLAAPRLPAYFAQLFENPIFLLLVFFLIIYSAQRSPTVAIIAAVGLLVSLQTLTKYKVNDQLVGMMHVQEQRAREEMENLAHHDQRHEATTGHDLHEGGVLMSSEMPEEVLSEIQEEEEQPVCRKKMDFRNQFYPQYVNMKPDAYLARLSDDDVSGFDPDAGYASI